jgi:hypothetical protein
MRKPSWRKKVIWKKYFQGPRIKFLDRPTNVEKGSPIFNLCLKDLKLFRTHLTWIPGNGKEMKVWEDSIMGNPMLISMEGLDRLNNWMRSQNLNNLWDISIWKQDEDNSWLRWEARNKPLEIEGEWNILMDFF